MTPLPDREPLEQVAREVASAWGLELGPTFALSRHSYVAPVGADAVLKVTSPDDDESAEEAGALALWGGDGAVRLLRHSRTSRALLIERAQPGGDLSQLREEQATAAAVEVGRRLWRPAAEPFRWIGDHVPGWLDRAEQASPSSRELAPLAQELYRTLDPGRSTIVHGDFHHHNILDAGGRYLAIDPKPMLGEPEYDVASFLWNPLGHRMTTEATQRRLAAFAATGLDEGRMRVWALIRGAYLGLGEHEVAVLRALL